MKSILLPVPPREEQDQIVRFLDWKVSSINKLINIKKKEIKAIDALKRSMVSHAITRGLTTDAPMKDSGFIHKFVFGDFDATDINIASDGISNNLVLIFFKHSNFFCQLSVNRVSFSVMSRIRKPTTILFLMI